MENVYRVSTKQHGDMKSRYFAIVGQSSVKIVATKTIQKRNHFASSVC